MVFFGCDLSVLKQLRSLCVCAYFKSKNKVFYSGCAVSFRKTIALVFPSLPAYFLLLIFYLLYHPRTQGNTVPFYYKDCEIDREALAQSFASLSEDLII